jgi:hypothetical protein
VVLVSPPREGTIALGAGAAVVHERVVGLNTAQEASTHGAPRWVRFESRDDCLDDPYVVVAVGVYVNAKLSKHRCSQNHIGLQAKVQATAVCQLRIIVGCQLSDHRDIQSMRFGALDCYGQDVGALTDMLKPRVENSGSKYRSDSRKASCNAISRAVWQRTTCCGREEPSYCPLTASCRVVAPRLHQSYVEAIDVV